MSGIVALMNHIYTEKSIGRNRSKVKTAQIIVCPGTTQFVGFIKTFVHSFLVARGVSGLASFIATDKQLQ